MSADNSPNCDYLRQPATNISGRLRAIKRVGVPIKSYNIGRQCVLKCPFLTPSFWLFPSEALKKLVPPRRVELRFGG